MYALNSFCFFVAFCENIMCIIGNVKAKGVLSCTHLLTAELESFFVLNVLVINICIFNMFSQISCMHYGFSLNRQYNYILLVFQQGSNFTVIT